MNKVPFFDLGAFVRPKKQELLARIEKVLESGTYIGGDAVSTFERRFAATVGAKHAIGVGNGLDALRILLEANDIGPGDEVLVPGFTFYATWLAVMQVGATPVAIDVEPETACLDPKFLETAISGKTRAILVVHLFGISANMREINKVAKKHNLLVFEDCAQAHLGQTTAGAVGNSSDGAAFSFYPTKNLGALGDAGAVCTNDDLVASKIRSRRSYGVGLTKYEHVDTGWNSRLDPIQAVILDLFLDTLSETTKRRQFIASEYEVALDKKSESFLAPIDGEKSVYHHFILTPVERRVAQSYFENQGVQTDVHYPYFFNSLSPIKKLYDERFLKVPELPVSRHLSETVLSMPIGPWMTKNQVDIVSKALSNSSHLWQ